MGKTIAICNNKGGVGRTSTAVNLAAVLADAGKRVLLIDADPIAGTTSYLGFGDKNDVCIYELMNEYMSAEEVIQPTGINKVDIIPSHYAAAELEIMLAKVESKEDILAKRIAPVKDMYDYILIDCGATITQLMINALVASDSVIIPLQAEYYALEGLNEFAQVIDRIRNGYNEKLDIEGIVFTMFDCRTRLSREVVEDVRNHYSDLIFETIIPRNIRIAEAASRNLPVIDYSRKSAGARCYRELGYEIIKKNNKK